MVYQLYWNQYLVECIKNIILYNSSCEERANDT